VVVAAGAVALYWQRSQAQKAATRAAVPFRTATVTSGTVQRTLRLSGTTGAERFGSLISPHLHGSRSGFGRDHNEGASTAATAPTIQSKQGGNTSPGASSGNSPNMSSSMRAATSRIAAPRSTTAATSTRSTSTTTSSALGADGLGSTSGSLGAGMGGGGGGGDFSLVLQEVAAAGSRVKKGDVVAEFDRQYMMQRLEDYQASVVQSEASITRLKSDLAVARKIKDQDIATAKSALEKAKLDVKTTPVLSAIDTERVKLALSEADATYARLLKDIKDFETSQAAQIRNAELDLQETKVELKRAEANVDRMLLKAPMDGLVVMQTIPRGGELAQVQKGDQLWPGMMFMTVVDTSSMVVNASVNQTDVEQLRIGQKATVRFDAYPDLRLPARVYSLGGVPKTGGQRESYVKEIAVRLKLEATDPRVIPDLSVSADVVLGSDENATVAPLAAIFRGEHDEQPFVYVRTPEGWVRREVEVGLRSNIVASIRSGLKPGEQVALEVPQKPGSTQVKVAGIR
jgi:hypothetical protein